MKLRSGNSYPNQAIFFSLFVIILTICIYFYWHGLYGPFILDDHPNLQPMSFFGGVTDWQGALYFTFSNHSGPLGRPLSMASFLLNDITWPSEPFSFKYTNLMIHLINGLLVFWFASLLFRKNSLWPLVIATVWLLHPLHTSSVLYVIQRMTLLSSTFILLTSIYYIKWRANLRDTTTHTQIITFISCLTFLGALGLLSKETAITVVFYIALLEFIWFDNCPSLLWKKYRYLFVVGPCLLVVSIIIIKGISSQGAWDLRQFNLLERLMTETRVVTQYLFNIIVPQSRNTGIFQDDWTISTSLFNPATTILSVTLIFLLVIFSLKLRNSYRVISFGLLWFFMGHILESTFLPLELYFEHRNYLPMLGIIISAVWLASRLKSKIVIAVSSIYFALFLYVLSAQVEIWSNERLMATIWSMEHQNSTRAQQTILEYAIKDGDVNLVKKTMTNLLSSDPNGHVNNLQKIIIDCITGQKHINLDEHIKKFSQGNAEIGVASGLLNLRGILNSKKCENLSWDELKRISETLTNNPSYQSTGSSRTLSFLYKELAMQGEATRNLDMAVGYLEKASAVDPNNISYPLTNAMWLSDAGLKDDAIYFLKIARSIKPANPMLEPKHKKLILEVDNYINGKI